MSQTEKLKKKAAEFEAKKQTDKAIATYLELFKAWESGDATDVDVALYNRVGDMLVRAGNVGDAMSVWEKAVDMYSETGLYNNAIALCNKILRNSPGRTSVYYKLGKASARKGLNSEARKNYLEYADRVQKTGQTDEAFRALKEFADLSPDNSDIRQMLADQLIKLGRKGEAIEQLQVLYERQETLGETAASAATVERMKALDPSIEPKRSGPSTAEAQSGLVFLTIDDEPIRPARKSGAMPVPKVPEPAPPRLETKKTPIGGLTFIDLDEPVKAPARNADPAPVTPPPVVEPPVVAAAPEPDAPAPEPVAEAPAQPQVRDITFGASFGTDDDAGSASAPVANLELMSFDSVSLDAPVSSSLSSAEDASFGTIELSDAPIGLGGGDAPFGSLEMIDVDAAPAGEPLKPAADLPLIDTSTPSAAHVAIERLETVEASAVASLESALELAENLPPVKQIDVVEPVVTVREEAPVPTPDLVEPEPTPIAEAELEVAAPVAEVAVPEVDAQPVEEPAATIEAPVPAPVPVPVPEPEVPLEAATPPADPDELAAVAPAAEELPAEPRQPRRTMRPTMSVLAQSVDLLRDRVKSDPSNWQLTRQLGEALLEDGDRNGGLDTMEAAMAGLERDGNLDAASSVADALLRLNPQSVRLHQKRVEYAYHMGDRARLIEAYVELADVLFRMGDADKAKAVYERVLALAPDESRALSAMRTLAPVAPEPAPVAPPPRRPTVAVPKAPPARETKAVPRMTTVAAKVEPPAPPPPPPRAKPKPQQDFVDLEDWLTEDEGPKSTRMIVEEKAPTGDENADFNDMLRKFKQGVAANVEDEDHESHYDLGVAFKEMGLVDEAIEQFQKALRGTEHRTRNYESLGQCFVEKGQPQVAMTILQRALVEPGAGDDQLVGVLYLLGVSAETVGQPADAVKYYQRVFAVDINFRDVQQRMRAIEQAG